MKNRQPLFHVVKRENTGPGLQMLTYVAAAALALAIGAVLLAAQGVAFFFLFLIRGYEGTNILFLSRMLPLCIYTAAAAVPAFLAVRWLHQRFQRLIYPAE